MNKTLKAKVAEFIKNNRKLSLYVILPMSVLVVGILVARVSGATSSNMGVAGTSQISSNPAIKNPPVAQRITDEEYLLDYKEAKALLESKDMKNRADGMVNMSRIPYVDSFTDVQIAEILIAHVAVSLVASELKPINRKLQCESVLRADQGMSLLVSRGYSRLDIKGSFSPNAKDMYKKAFALAAPFDCEKEGYSY